MLSLVVDTARHQPTELRAREDFLGRISGLDARWFGGGLRALGERTLADPSISEAYRFSWFTPKQTLKVARVSRYPIGAFSRAWVAEGWPVRPRRRVIPRRLSTRTLVALRAQVDRTDWAPPAAPRSEGRWMLESWRGGVYRARADWGAHLTTLPAGGLALLLLTDLNP